MHYLSATNYLINAFIRANSCQYKKSTLESHNGAMDPHCDISSLWCSSWASLGFLSLATISTSQVPQRLLQPWKRAILTNRSYLFIPQPSHPSQFLPGLPADTSFPMYYLLRFSNLKHLAEHISELLYILMEMNAAAHAPDALVNPNISTVPNH